MKRLFAKEDCFAERKRCLAVALIHSFWAGLFLAFRTFWKTDEKEAFALPYALNDKIRELTPYRPISGPFRSAWMPTSPIFLPEPVLAEIRPRLEKLDFNRYPDPIGGGIMPGFAGYYGIDPKFVTAGKRIG